MAMPLFAALLAALTLAADGPGADQVQLTKRVCKTTLEAPRSDPMICTGAMGRLSDPDYCRCAIGKIEVKVPACHRDGSPVMGPTDARPSYGDNNRLIACEDQRHDHH